MTPEIRKKIFVYSVFLSALIYAVCYIDTQSYVLSTALFVIYWLFVFVFVYFKILLIIIANIYFKKLLSE